MNKNIKIIFFLLYILFSIIIISFLILIVLARCWKKRKNHLFKNKSPFEGSDSNIFNNIILNSLNELMSLYIPKKYDTPFLPWRELYPKVEILQKYWKDIQKEAKSVMQIAPSYGDLDERNKGLSTHDNHYWKTFVLKYYKGFNKKNCEKCPITTHLLKQLPEINLAMFSILEPGKKLYAHYGPWRGVLRIHLGLKIPDSKPIINVGRESYTWKEGELVAFDDTHLHSVDNPKENGGIRVILFMDIYRPDIPKFFHKLSALGNSYFSAVNKKTEEKAKQN